MKAIFLMSTACPDYSCASLCLYMCLYLSLISSFERGRAKQRDQYIVHSLFLPFSATYFSYCASRILKFRENDRFSVRGLLSLSISISVSICLSSLFLFLFATRRRKTIRNERLGTRQESRGQWSDFSVSQGNMSP